ncbi:unnamed protein product, partial [Ectocarpus sp. 8 AP-2014]
RSSRSSALPRRRSTSEYGGRPPSRRVRRKVRARRCLCLPLSRGLASASRLASLSLESPSCSLPAVCVGWHGKRADSAGRASWEGPTFDSEGAAGCLTGRRRINPPP